MFVSCAILHFRIFYKRLKICRLIISNCCINLLPTCIVPSKIGQYIIKQLQLRCLKIQTVNN